MKTLMAIPLVNRTLRKRHTLLSIESLYQQSYRPRSASHPIGASTHVWGNFSRKEEAAYPAVGETELSQLRKSRKNNLLHAWKTVERNGANGCLGVLGTRCGYTPVLGVSIGIDLGAWETSHKPGFVGWSSKLVNCRHVWVSLICAKLS